MKKLLAILPLVVGTSTLTASTALQKVTAVQQAEISLLKGSVFSVGSIQQSVLSEAQFQSLNGSSWVLMNGQGVKGSRYTEITGKDTVPNAVGAFLRMAGGKASEIGTVQEDATAVNGLGVLRNGNHNHSTDFRFKDLAARGKDVGVPHPAYPVDHRYDWTSHHAGSHIHNLTGDAETRPVNIAVNYFIKVN